MDETSADTLETDRSCLSKLIHTVDHHLYVVLGDSIIFLNQFEKASTIIAPQINVIAYQMLSRSKVSIAFLCHRVCGQAAISS